MSLVDASSTSTPVLTIVDSTADKPKKSRIRGGFVEEDSDDEDALITPTFASGEDPDEAPYEPELSLPTYPEHTSVQSAGNTTSGHADAPASAPSEENAVDSVAPEEVTKTGHNVTSETTLNGASSSAMPSIQPTVATAGAPQSAAATPTPSAQAPALQISTRVRLPHDRVGILEDRITEDPRGDLEAWLALIEEHRTRNKTDEARAVYDRFFKVFPMAVSLPSPIRSVIIC
jgi:cleavage stimulation factor subunit 3